MCEINFSAFIHTLRARESINYGSCSTAIYLSFLLLSNNEKMEFQETFRGQHFGCTGKTGSEIGVFGMMSSILLSIHMMVNIINASNNNNNNNK